MYNSHCDRSVRPFRSMPTTGNYDQMARRRWLQTSLFQSEFHMAPLRQDMRADWWDFEMRLIWSSARKKDGSRMSRYGISTTDKDHVAMKDVRSGSNRTSTPGAMTLSKPAKMKSTESSLTFCKLLLPPRSRIASKRTSSLSRRSGSNMWSAWWAFGRSNSHYTPWIHGRIAPILSNSFRMLPVCWESQN